MRLLVVSHTPHYRGNEGAILGQASTVRELDHLATLFDSVVHVAFLHDERAPDNACPYADPRITFQPLQPAGGGVVGKLHVLWKAPAWLRVISAELRNCDVVHVRCPANVSLLALLFLTVRRQTRTRWVKYAGNWAPTQREAMSYRLQRWLLRSNIPRAVVTVNGSWPEQPPHIVTFLNPTFTDEELARAADMAASKRLGDPLRILYAGRLEERKGAGRALDVVQHLVEDGLFTHIDLAGDGPDRIECEHRVKHQGLSPNVTFHGWLKRQDLDELYRIAHVFLLLSSSEGFPKVVAEAMAYGAVPIVSDVSSIPQVLGDAGAGRCVPPSDTVAAAAAVQALLAPGEWQRQSEASVVAAAAFSYSRYLQAVRSLFVTRYGITLAARAERPVECSGL